MSVLTQQQGLHYIRSDFKTIFIKTDLGITKLQKIVKGGSYGKRTISRQRRQTTTGRSTTGSGFRVFTREKSRSRPQES